MRIEAVDTFQTVICQASKCFVITLNYASWMALLGYRAGWSGLMGPSGGHSVSRADGGFTLSHLAAGAWNMLWNPHLVISVCKWRRNKRFLQGTFFWLPHLRCSTLYYVFGQYILCKMYLFVTGCCRVQRLFLLHWFFPPLDIFLHSLCFKMITLH